MRTLVIALSLILLSACENHSIERAMRADALKRSGADCGHRKGGCEVFIKASGQGWFVRIEPARYSVEGERMWMPGGNYNFYYKTDGSFGYEVPDM